VASCAFVVAAMLCGRSRGAERQRDGGAAARRPADRQGTTGRLGDPPGDVQAESGGTPAGGAAHDREAVRVIGEARSVVGDREPGAAAGPPR